MRTPATALPLWLSAFGLGVLILPLVMYSSHLYYEEGGKNPDAPAMLLASLIGTLPIWLGAWLLFNALYLIRYPGAVSLVFRRTPGFVGAFLAILAVAVSLFFVWLAVAHIEFWRPSRLPFFAHLLGCALHVQFLRAAAVGRSRGGRMVPAVVPPGP